MRIKLRRSTIESLFDECDSGNTTEIGVGQEAYRVAMQELAPDKGDAYEFITRDISPTTLYIILQEMEYGYRKYKGIGEKKEKAYEG